MPYSLTLFASLSVPVVAAGAFAAAVAVPVLIHLLFRQRFRVVEWAAMRFLSAAKKKSTRRIDRWLLLALRVLAVLMPLIGMTAATPWAEPFWQAITPGAPETIANAPRTHHILVVDLSLSMSARVDQRSRFEVAVEKAEAAVHAANAGDGFTLIALGPQTVPVVPGPSNDAEKVLAELHALKPTHGPSDLAAGLAAVNDALARSPRSYLRRQVMLFTDLQAVAWGGLLPKADAPPPEVWTKLTARGDLAVVDCAKDDTENTAVTSLTTSDPLPLVNDTLSVTAVVQHFGKTARQKVRVELLLGRPAENGGEASLVSVEQQVVEQLPPNEATPVRFTLPEAARFRTAGTHAVQVRIVEPDDLPADDSRSMSFEVRDGLPCVLVNGKPSSVPLQRATESLADAIAPGGKPRPGHPGRPKVISLEEFTDATLSDLSAVDCVFLCDVPTFTPSQVARLDAVLKRGGGVVFGLGARAAANAEHYNRVLFDDGKGMLPGKLGPVVSTTGPDDPGFRLVGDDAAFRQPPLAAEFQDVNARAGLTAVPFAKYVRLELPIGRGRRILSFAPAEGAKASNRKPEPAVVEWSRHRGRVIVYTSTFNRDWNDWPILPTYPVFAGELLRFAATNPERQSVRVGESVEEYLPPATVGLTAKLVGPAGAVESAAVVATDEGGVARFADTHAAGLYRFEVAGRPSKFVAVNIPDATPGGGSESDLRRLNPATIKGVHPSVQVIHDPGEVAIHDDSGTTVVTAARPHGPMLARWFVTVGFLALAFELWLAWRLGPARIAVGIRGDATPQPSAFGGVFKLFAVVLLVAAAAVLFTLVHSWWTGELLGFLPDEWRQAVERTAGVPSAGPGEGTRWRLEQSPAFSPNARLDQQIQWGLAGFALLIVVVFYGYERRATTGTRRVILPALLRLSAYWLVIFLVLPQLRLAFDREGWPDVAVLIDTSASMATVDDPQDPAVRAKIESLAKLPGLDRPQRIQLAKWLFTRPDGDWLTRLVDERKLKVHVYSLAEQARLVGTINESGEQKGVSDAIAPLEATGEESRLGDGVGAVLKSFRGGSLAAVIVLTDGQTTAGDDLPRAARAAARADVPLYLVGLGDAKDALDLAVGDLRSDDVIARNDELVFEGRLTAKGIGVPQAVRVTLSEKVGDRLEPRDEVTIKPDAAGKPVTFRLKHVPSELGERSYVIEVPPQPGEVETANNKIERQIVVTENRKLRVLFVDGSPRYEFRFVKVLLEREVEPGRREKAVEIHTLLLDASADHATTDRSALRGFPTRNELFDYDVVILGDVDPKRLDRPTQRLQDLAEFVKQKGGGLIVIAGEQAAPQLFFDTPLADMLPVARTKGGDAPRPTSEETPVAVGYQPRLTPVGVSHPIFRFAANETESAAVWQRLKPLFWVASGYVKKDTAEVLATHPDRPAEDDPGEKHPLVLQQFAGAGRVLFLGFDETWRWRFRKDEEQFNRFWRQAITVLARNRVRRVELKTDKQTGYRRDEPIRVTVQFPDDAAPPVGAVKVGVERSPLRDGSGRVITGDSETQTLTLAKVRGSRASYEATLTRTPVGEYRFQLTDPAPTGLKPKAEARVLPPPGELDRLEMNKNDLTRAAAESRGKFYTFADADKLLDDLPEVARLPLNQPCPPLPVWNHAVTFALLLLLLGCEWILRKRERLL
ncbi:VWA domain-containing protein [Limnoglobus roseus]|uniref:VWA domain-containing protein n=1 Tax=Limnoglobus roseus TaxID=2598579 RepID=A0A5C1A772_9BACT|nr:VWA domain-containing protein [Limnoglobus roseus]QEL15051.1 VWA domain-containing protein [Limnoglobus roseus]